MKTSKLSSLVFSLCLSATANATDFTGTISNIETSNIFGFPTLAVTIQTPTTTQTCYTVDMILEDLKLNGVPYRQSYDINSKVLSTAWAADKAITMSCDDTIGIFIERVSS